MGSSIITSINLNDQDFLEKIAREWQNPGWHYKLLADPFIRDAGMQRISERGYPNGGLSATVATWLQRTYEIRVRGQVYGTVTLHLPVLHSITVEPTILLAAQGALTPEIIQKATSIFQNYNFASDGNIDSYILKNCYEQQIPYQSFSLFADGDIYLIHSNLDLEAERGLIQGGFDWRKYIPSVPPGEEVGVDIVAVRDLPVAAYVPQTSKNTLQGPIDESQLRRVAQNAAESHHCASDEVVQFKIASMDTVPGCRTVARWVTQIDSCGMVIGFWGAVVQYQRKELVLYATLTYTRADQRLKSIFESCLKDAAISAAVVGAAFESLEAAIVIFKETFWRLLRERIEEYINCLLPDLYIAEESGDWH